jgi:hypothetical protein
MSVNIKLKGNEMNAIQGNSGASQTLQQRDFSLRDPAPINRAGRKPGRSARNDGWCLMVVYAWRPFEVPLEARGRQDEPKLPTC